MKLSDAANLRSGLVLKRKQATENPIITYPLINLRMFTEDYSLNLNECDRFGSCEKLSEYYFTQNGDVLLKLPRPQHAVVIDKSLCGLLISSAFAVVRPDTSVLVPGYLAWYLNSREVEKEITKSTGKNMFGTANLKAYADLEIPLISLDKQKKIAEICELELREIRLERERMELKRKQYEMIKYAIAGAGVLSSAK